MRTDKDYKFDSEGNLVVIKDKELVLDKFPSPLLHDVIAIILGLIWVIGYIAIMVVICWYIATIFLPFYIKLLIGIMQHHSIFGAISSLSIKPSLLVVPMSFLWSKAYLNAIPPDIKNKVIITTTDNVVTVHAKKFLYLLFFWISFFALSGIIK